MNVEKIDRNMDSVKKGMDPLQKTLQRVCLYATIALSFYYLVSGSIHMKNRVLSLCQILNHD
jgi:hypothetical protein